MVTPNVPIPETPPHLVNKDAQQDALIQQVIRNRKRNTLGLMLIGVALLISTTIGYYAYKELKEKKAIQSEIAQLVVDEGYRRCAYKDTLGKYTIGFGHLITKDDVILKQQVKGKLCISAHDAVSLLRQDYTYAYNSVATKYGWAEDEAKQILVNMTYQMGATGVSKFAIMLDNLRNSKYDDAASEMLDSRWANQTSIRASRLAGRIMALN